MTAILIASLKEVINKKLFYIVISVTAIYLILFSLIVFYYVQDISRNYQGSTLQIYVMASQIVSIPGFYFSSMLASFLTIVISIGTISSEIENGTIQSIITKSIRRWEYVLGKYIGLAIPITAYSILLYISVLAVCAAARLPLLGNLGVCQVITGLLHFILQQLAILSLSIFCSSMFKTIINGVIVISIYIFGLIGGMMEQIGGMLTNTKSLYYIGMISSMPSPFDAIYRKMVSELFSNIGVTNPVFGAVRVTGTVPSGWMVVYVVIYLIVLLIFAVNRFEKRDIG